LQWGDVILLYLDLYLPAIGETCLNQLPFLIGGTDSLDVLQVHLPIPSVFITT